MRTLGKSFDLKGFAEAFGEAFDAAGFVTAFRSAFDLGGAGKSAVSGFKQGADLLIGPIRRARRPVSEAARRASGGFSMTGPDLGFGFDRRLTTILAADIVGYSGLMRATEDSTMRALGAYRAIMDALVAEHRGRIAYTAGDGVLAEFPSVADGLSCALAMQQAVAAENEGVPQVHRMQFRIGLHLGDFIISEGDLYGDVVNVAARLEALAEPGGICVSATVREVVGARVAAAFTDIGPQQLKNIDAPVRVFRVAASGGSPIAEATQAKDGAGDAQPPTPAK